MQLIFNQEYFANVMTDLNYDSAKLPLGKLSKATISRGFQALKDLSALLDDPSLAGSQYGTSFPQASEQLSNLFFTIIPHSFGRNRPPVIRTQTLLKKEIELLESLGDMKDAALLMKVDKKEEINELDRQFRGLGLRESRFTVSFANENQHILWFLPMALFVIMLNIMHSLAANI